MVYTHRYILQFQSNKINYSVDTKCIDILVLKDGGYFHGAHHFPSTISVNCLQIASAIDETYFIKIWLKPSMNCSCKTDQENIKRELDCHRRCLADKTDMLAKCNFPFVHGK